MQAFFISHIRQLGVVGEHGPLGYCVGPRSRNVVPLPVLPGI